MITLDSRHAFCEWAGASGGSRYHIRTLTTKGKKLGGGADTLALCGREVAWDLAIDIAREEHVCQKCSDLFRK